VKLTKDMLELAMHIVEQKSGHFEPTKFEDHYESALQDLLAKKQKGLPIAAAPKGRPSNVIDLMSALKASMQGGKRTAATKPPKAVKKARPAGKRKAS
jgi:DNA end-binding protein Ku